MTRYVAMLTLVLTAALSADEAFAQIDPEILGVVNAGDGQYIVDKDTAHIPLDSVIDPSECPTVYADDLDALIAIIAFDSSDFANAFCGDDDLWVFIAERFEIDHVSRIAFEYGPEAAYKMLRDMGFSPEEADDMVLGVLVNNENIPTWAVD